MSKNITNALTELGVSNTPPTYWITSFAASVERKYLNETYSYGNVFSFDIEGKTYENNTQDRLSAALYNRIRDIALKGGFNFKIKSLNFPNSPEEGSDGMKILKFSAKVEFEEKILSAHTDFTNRNPQGAQFLNTVGPALINNGDLIKDYSENFDFDEGENGTCVFTHSVNLSLVQKNRNPIEADRDFIARIRTDLKNTATTIFDAAKNYTAFNTLANLFTGQGFKFVNANWQEHFISAFDNSFTLSETFDLFAHSYSLTRKKSYSANRNPGHFVNFSYDLNIDSAGIIEITEKAEVKGNTNYTALRNNFNVHIWGGSGSPPIVIDGRSYVRTHSYNRCKTFLDKYQRFLRKTQAEFNTATSLLDNYAANSVDPATRPLFLKPILIESSFTAVPESPSITATRKYSTNPNIRSGYEVNSVIKFSQVGSVINCTHSFDVKTYNFKDRDLFNWKVTSPVFNFSDFKTASINSSFTEVHRVLNAPGGVKNLKRNPDTLAPLARIKQSSKISRRGKDFNLTLEYSSDNKYAPLWFNQRGNSTSNIMPPQGIMFNNLLGPISANLHPILANNFTTFDRKVENILPVEKFTERIVLGRPASISNSIIDPSVSSSTGKQKITITAKIRKNQIGVIPEAGTQHGSVAANSQINEFYTGVTPNLLPGSVPRFLNKILFIRNLFFGPTPTLAPIIAFDRLNLIGIGLSPTHPVAQYAPSSVSYSFDSDFNFSITVEIEYYSKSANSKRKPIFGHVGNQVFPNSSVNVSTTFGQATNFQ